MKHCRPWMFVVCGVVLLLLVLLPLLGVTVPAGGLLFVLIMVGCCVLPMFFAMMVRGDGRSGGCCKNGEPEVAEAVPAGEKKTTAPPRCH